MNSVDFRLEIKVFKQAGCLDEKVGELYVTGYDLPFSKIKITRQIKDLHGKIIECRWAVDEKGNRWEFMRERVDKSYPNHVSTAKGNKN